MVNIIGKGIGWKEAPEISKEYETWGLTQVLLRRPVDLVIDMNVYEDLRWGKSEMYQNTEVKDRCKTENIPYIGLLDYPLKEIVKEFKVAYFTSTIAYAIALAITKKPETINLFGINLSYLNKPEYFEQKPCVDFWVGMAMGRGIKVNIHGKLSEVRRAFKGIVYGYDLDQAEVEKCI